MKVVFLDIDGVLNEEKSRSRCCGYKGIDDKKVENLAKIVKQTNAEIVLISTWKDDWFRPSLNFSEYRKQGILGTYLNKKMKKQGLCIFDKTESVDKVSGMHFSRGESIVQYLRRNNVKEFVILDDYQFDYDSCGLTNYHIKTDAYKGGLTEEFALKAIQILNGGK